MGKQLLFLFAGILVLLFASCGKEDTRVETVTVRDTVYLHDTTIIPALISDTITTLIILRHAERENAGNDPDLTSAGVARAEELSRLLGNVQVAAVYTTPYNRTRQTVQPLASAKGVSVLEYDPNRPIAELMAEMIAANRGKVAVIAGHSDTVPLMLFELSGGAFSVVIGEEEYDNLFIVSLPDNLSPGTTHLKYGQPTP